MTSDDLSVISLLASFAFVFATEWSYILNYLTFIAYAFKRTPHYLVLLMRKGDELSRNVQNLSDSSEDLTFIYLADSQYSLQRPFPGAFYFRLEDTGGQISK